jgi:hypothetical protein
MGAVGPGQLTSALGLDLAGPRADLQMAATDVAPCRKSRGTCGTLGRSLEYLDTYLTARPSRRCFYGHVSVG